MKQKGYFITFEGPDGSGKTTISNLVYQKLIEGGFDCIYTREPGGIEIAEKIRDIILNPEHTSMDKKTEALLYAASRRQHLVEKVLPALEANKIVICDRFVDSSLAYQGFGRGIGFDEVYEMNEFAIEGYLPDLTIFLDIDAQTGLDRIQSRSYKDRLDREAISFHQQVFEGYQEVVKRFKDRIVMVDGKQKIEAIAEEAYQIIMARIV